MKIPYGVADFYSLRTEGHLYVDRTNHIAVIEALGKSLLFLRPRRFGKSLWLSTLACYYDLRLRDEHERLFGGLAVGRNPTPLAHRYFVLRWDFSQIDPDPPMRGPNAGVTSRAGRIGNEIHRYVNSSLRSLVSDSRDHLSEDVALGNDAFSNLDRLLDVIRRTPYRLYLLIDEYDNFANEVLTADRGTYEDLVHSDGPFKYLFKWVKAAMAGQGLDRLFIAGVSPMVMSDVTSGLNIVRNVHLKPALAGLCGFTDEEIDALLDEALRARREASEITKEDAKLMMREWYNGYRFALGVPQKIYNPTLAFYFLLEVLEEGRSPRKMLDANLAVDEGKLEYLARVVRGDRAGSEITPRDTLIDLIRRGQPLQMRELHDHFTLAELLEHSSQDTSFVPTQKPRSGIDMSTSACCVDPTHTPRTSGIFCSNSNDSPSRS